MKILRLISDIKNDAIEAMEEIREAPVSGLAQLAPVVLNVLAICGWIVTYCLFIFNGGYTSQIDILKARGISGIEEIFTVGNVEMITKGVFPICEGVLFSLGLILTIMLYFQEERKIKKILMAIDCVVACILISIIVFLNGLNLSDVYDMFGESAVTVIRELFFPIIICILVTVLILLILLFFSNCRDVIQKNLVALGRSFIVAPLSLLVVENIIPMAILGIMFGIIYLVFVISREGEGAGSITNDYARSNIPERKKSSDNANNNIKKHELSGDVQLWVERDAFGTELINAYRKWNGKYTQLVHWGVTTDVSLYNFKKGNVEIWINKKRATEKDLHYGERRV